MKTAIEFSEHIYNLHESTRQATLDNEIEIKAEILMLELLTNVGIDDKTLGVWITAMESENKDRIFKLRQIGVKRAMQWVIKKR